MIDQRQIVFVGVLPIGIIILHILRAIGRGGLAWILGRIPNRAAWVWMTMSTCGFCWCSDWTMLSRLATDFSMEILFLGTESLMENSTLLALACPDSSRSTLPEAVALPNWECCPDWGGVDERHLSGNCLSK